MNRLTYYENGKARCDFNDTQYQNEIVSRLAAYEDSGLEPDEIKTAKDIAARLALADYPHNFQRERSDISEYMYWISENMKEAKIWWRMLIDRDDAEALNMAYTEKKAASDAGTSGAAQMEEYKAFPLPSDNTTEAEESQ